MNIHEGKSLNQRDCAWQNLQNDLCARWWLTQAWTSNQSYQIIQSVLNSGLKTDAFLMYKAKTDQPVVVLEQDTFILA